MKEDLSLATKVGRKLFPAEEAELIADVVERDLPFYSTAISPEFVTGMNKFQKDVGLVNGDFAYDQVVASEFSVYWS